MVAAVLDESTDAAFVLTADGKADVFGADAATLRRSLQGAFGEHRFDWEACGQDLTVKGILAGLTEVAPQSRSGIPSP